ncbi:MAG: sodium:solute symporter family protein, partial [Eggerthellaceae bacterium]|nr:sodium:solute symporter family protein [Eggerthellaceae bacterium]
MIEKIILVLIFVAVAVGVGIYCKRSTSTVDGFVLGGRKVGPWMSAFAYGTSYFSAVVFVGYAGQFGFKYGIAATWAGIGNAILGSLLAWWVLGPRTREITHRLGAQTMPEFFGKRYNSKALRIAAAAIIFIFLIPYTASVYNGLSRLFGMAFDLPYDVCVIGMAVITCVYVVVGGYMATVMNDFIQGIVMLLGITAVIVAVLLSNGGFSEAIIQLSQVPAEGSAMEGAFVSFFGPDLFNLLGVVILTSLGTWGLPQMVQKFYAIKSGPAVKQGAIISTIFAFVVAGGSYFLGGFGRLYEGQIEYAANGTPIYDSVIPTMLATLPDVLIGLVIVLVLSASMSTLSSLVLTSSSTLTIDLIKDNFVKNMKEKQQLVCMRGLLVVFIAISAVIALVQYHSSIVFIAQLMGYSWGALAGAFLGPFLWGLYKKKVSKAAVWCSFIFGVGLTAVNMIMGFMGTPLIASPINCGALCMIVSLIIVPVVSLFTPADEFQIDPPSRLSASDREFEAEVAAQVAAGDPVPGSAADGAREGIAPEVQDDWFNRRRRNKGKDRDGGFPDARRSVQGAPSLL